MIKLDTDTSKIVGKDTWYELEWSRAGAQDWATSASSDREEEVRYIMGEENKVNDRGVEYRIVRKTTITEVIE